MKGSCNTGADAQTIPCGAVSAPSINNTPPGDFFVKSPPATQNLAPAQILGIPNFGLHLVLRKIILSISKLDVLKLEILQIKLIQDISTNSIVPFHKLDPKLVH